MNHMIVTASSLGPCLHLADLVHALMDVKTHRINIAEEAGGNCET